MRVEEQRAELARWLRLQSVRVLSVLFFAERIVVDEARPRPVLEHLIESAVLRAPASTVRLGEQRLIDSSLMAQK